MCLYNNNFWVYKQWVGVWKANRCSQDFVSLYIDQFIINYIANLYTFYIQKNMAFQNLIIIASILASYTVYGGNYQRYNHQPNPHYQQRPQYYSHHQAAKVNPAPVAPVRQSVVDVLVKNSIYSTLVTAVQKAGLAETLATGI